MGLSTAAKVGVFTLIAMIALGLMITWKSNLFLIRDGFELTGSFANIEGLTVGSEVRYRGLNIGKVTKIDPGPVEMIVYTMVQKGVVVPADSKLRIGFDGIVGQKYLEIRPGISSEAYRSGNVIQGISTSGIVDFVDIGSQNLVETKKILMSFRSIIEDSRFQNAIKNAVYTAEKITIDVDKLTEELRQTNDGIRKITTDPKFQESIKGTVSETNKTLSSANKFFDSFGKLNVKPSADIQYGSAANSIRANLDVVQTSADYLRFGVGEGPTQGAGLGLLDVEISKRVYSNLGLRLGMINTYLGGGLDVFPNPDLTLSGDMYDFNNPKPAVPKIRATAAYNFFDYTDLLLQADDIFNPQRNYSFGIRVKGVGD